MSYSDRKTPRALHTWVCLARAAGRVGSDLHVHLQPTGLTPSQFGALEALLNLGPMRQKELGQKVLRSENNMTTVVDNLENQVLVSRETDPNDRRSKLVKLTPKGRRLIKKVFKEHASIVTDRFAGLTATEQDQLARLCRKLGLGA